MDRAVRKAAPRLRRDFGEVEQLQVSRKGPADFVSMADKRAEQTIVEELRSARPDWGMLLELWEERPISVQLPDQVEATIVEADAVVKGQTASSSYKPAILDNGVRVMVPPHISAGTRIVVDVYEQTYVRRAE